MPYNTRFSTRLWGILTTHKFDMGNPEYNRSYSEATISFIWQDIGLIPPYQSDGSRSLET